MEFKFEIDGRVFSFQVGFKTKWFQQIWQVALIEEWYNESMEVEYAELIWSKEKL